MIYGDELSDCDTTTNTRTPSKNTFPALIANYIDAEYDCQALSGGSNDRTERLLHQYLLTHEEEKFGVIIGWTSINRREYNDDGYYFTLQPNRKDTEYPKMQKAHELIVASYSPDDLVLEMYQKIFRTQHMLQNLKIPYIMVNMMYWDEKQNYDNILDLIQIQQSSFLAWADTHKYAIGPKGHPLEQAHLDFFNKLKTYSTIY